MFMNFGERFVAAFLHFCWCACQVGPPWKIVCAMMILELEYE